MLSSAKSPSRSMVIETIREWLASTVKELGGKLSKLLKFVDSGERLYQLRKDVLSQISLIERQTEWPSIIDKKRPSLSRRRSTYEQDATKRAVKFSSHRTWTQLKEEEIVGFDFSYWKSLFRDPFFTRAQDIIKISFQKLADQPTSILEPLLDDLSKPGIISSSYDDKLTCRRMSGPRRLDYQSLAFRWFTDVIRLQRVLTRALKKPWFRFKSTWPLSYRTTLKRGYPGFILGHGKLLYPMPLLIEEAVC